MKYDDTVLQGIVTTNGGRAIMGIVKALTNNPSKDTIKTALRLLDVFENTVANIKKAGATKSQNRANNHVIATEAHSRLAKEKRLLLRASILKCIKTSGGCNIGRICEYTCSHRPKIAIMLKEMADNGEVVRQRGKREKGTPFMYFEKGTVL